MTAARLAQVEVIDADGRGGRIVDVHAWPLRIGRALDNDLVLPDPHVAAHHASIEPDVDGRLQLSIGECLNGARIEHGLKHLVLRSGDKAPLPALARWRLGHSQLLLRRPEDPLVPELALAPGLGAGIRGLTPALATAALLWLLGWEWLGSDADTKWIDYVRGVFAALAVLLGWGLAWGLISKLFTGRFSLAPHIRLALVFGLGLQAAELLLIVLAFSADWPLLSHLRTPVAIVIVALWITQHLGQIQPQRTREMSAWVGTCTALILAVAMVATWHRSDRLLDELYAPHLLPPSWRLARGQSVPDLVQDLRALEQPLLERAAKALAEDYQP